MKIVKFFKATIDYFKYMSEHPTDYTKQREFINLVENNNAILEALVQEVWQPNKTLVENQVIWSPNMPANRVAVVTTAGTTADSEPTWSENTTDGTVTYILKESVPTESFSYLNVYPIGSVIYMTKPTNPADLWGGTWERIDDAYALIEANSTYPAGNKGGEFEHTLTTAELPSHSHGGTISGGSHNHTASSSSAGAHTHTVALGYVDNDYDDVSLVKYRTGTSNTAKTESAGAHSHTVTVNTSASHSHSFVGGTAGGGKAHNNMMRSLAVYIWRRTA